MSLNVWLNEGFIKKHESSPEEVSQILKTIRRNLQNADNAKTSDITPDGQLLFAYNAVKHCASLALAASGYRCPTKAGHHYYSIQSLRHTIGLDEKKVNILDDFLDKRNISQYMLPDTISQNEADELLELANHLFETVKSWLKDNHSDLVQGSE